MAPLCTLTFASLIAELVGVFVFFAGDVEIFTRLVDCAGFDDLFCFPEGCCASGGWESLWHGWESMESGFLFLC